MAKLNTVLGALGGDIIGSIYEYDNILTPHFDPLNENCHYTDDSVLTIATLESLLLKESFKNTYLKYGKEFPNEDYGERFSGWLNMDNPQPYYSFGNGAAMRVSPVACRSGVQHCKTDAQKSAECTHNHPEGINGAVSVAIACYFSRILENKQLIIDGIRLHNTKFNYDLSLTINQLREKQVFSETCQNAVPIALQAFFEGNDYLDVVQKAISVGGDSDTIACIAGSIAGSYYEEVDDEVANFILERLPPRLKVVYEKFEQTMRWPWEKNLFFYINY